MKIRLRAICCLPVMLAACSTLAVAANAPKDISAMHSATPAGYDVVILKPSGVNLALMGLIECPELEGAQRVASGMEAKLVSSDGGTIKMFPGHFSFRITATLQKVVVDSAASTLEYRGDPRELLLQLKFRVKAYRGLEVREITPDSIELIGMPAEVPYDERIYRVNIKTADMPITDRLVIEILSPQGEVLTHFPFNLL
ncbi:MAG TPA: hypothetical protein VFT65_12465 [Candidatus Angelobacter sp.]|nr:hypothetical protein [Candidatus Angelobacter sp.]